MEGSPLGAFLSSSLPLQYRFTCASLTFLAFSDTSSCKFGAAPWTLNASPCSAPGIMTSSGSCGWESACASVVSGEEISETGFEALASCSGEALERLLAEGWAMKGLVTLLERPLKARVFWACDEGAEDLRRVGGMMWDM